MSYKYFEIDVFWGMTKKFGNYLKHKFQTVVLTNMFINMISI